MDQAGPSYTTKITDLNFDCLESCFQHLNIDDLMNVAGCNKQLNYVVRYTIRRQSKGNLKMRYENCRTSNGQLDWYSHRNGKTLMMGRKNDLKSSLQFLRSFGDLVSKLECNSDEFEELNSVKNDLVVNYVNEYCSEFLTTMAFRWCSKGSMAGLTKQFRKVEKLEFVESFPIDKKLNELFPNMRELEVLCGDAVFPDYFFADNYPSLEHLSVMGYDCENHYENLAILLRSNPQLKSLHGNIWLHVFSHTKIVPFEQMQNLEKLHLTPIDNIEAIDEIIHLKNLRELVFHGTFSIIPFRSDKLESLDLHYCGGNGTDIIRMISNYSSIKRLKLRAHRIDQLEELSMASPWLEEIDFSNYWTTFTLIEVVRFINKFHSLRLFLFRSYRHVISKLTERLGIRWLVTSKLDENFDPNKYTRKIPQRTITLTKVFMKPETVL